MTSRQFTAQEIDFIMDSAEAGDKQETIASALDVHASELCVLLRDEKIWDRYRAAKKKRLYAHADNLLTAHDDIEDVRRARLYSDNVKFLLARQLRHEYGDSIDVNINQTVDIRAAQELGRQRAMAIQRGVTIDADTEHSNGILYIRSEAETIDDVSVADTEVVIKTTDT
jgi:hypothetical protein